MSNQQNIVIIGGGFAGTSIIQILSKKLSSNYKLIVISEESYTTFHPMLPEAVGASIFPEQVVAPIREIMNRDLNSQFMMGKVIAIDKTSKQIDFVTLAGIQSINYSHLVIACGNRARLDLLPGMASHAMPLKTIGDAMAIRNAVLRRLAQIELETDLTLRKKLGHFIVIGGGFSGVEVAGELIDCLKSITKYYCRVAAHELKVTVIHDADRLLLELPPSLGEAAKKSLEKRGVEIILKVRAQEITNEGVKFSNGVFLNGSTVISTIGTRPNTLLEATKFPLEKGRIIVNPDLSVQGEADVWAAGDCALVPNAYDQKFAFPTAQFAVNEGKLIAKNILCVIDGKQTKPFSYQSRGMMAAIGHKKGVAEIFGVSFSGLPAWLLWRAYYLSQMPTFGRKLRIFVEWTWGMFFPADITHLRFTKSHELEENDKNL